MKKYLIILTLLTNMLYGNTSKFNTEQIELLMKIKDYGKQYDLSNSLMAIAVVESMAGKYIVGCDSKDYGVFQINIHTAISKNKIPNTIMNRNILAQKLIFNFNFNIDNAISELLFWKKIHGKDNFLKIWSSYNTGWNYKSERGIRYANRVANEIQNLKKLNLIK